MEFDDKISVVVNKLALVMEDMGMPHNAGKIFLSLYLSDTPYLSTKELIQITGASKASVSLITRMMIQLGLMEKTTIYGKRGIYYRLAENPIVEVFRRKIESLQKMLKIESECLKLLEDSHPYAVSKLKEMHYFHEFISKEMPVLFMKWIEKRNEIIRELENEHKKEKHKGDNK